jgi:predicted nucleic acid-binding protein
MAEILVDTSFLVALNSRKDKYHVQAAAFAEACEDTHLFVLLP